MEQHDKPPSLAFIGQRRMSFLCGVIDTSPRAHLWRRAYGDTDTGRQLCITIRAALNLAFSKWEQIFKDPMTTAAAIDRLVHHSIILELNLPRYRMEAAKKSQNEDGIGVLRGQELIEACFKAFISAQQGILIK